MSVAAPPRSYRRELGVLTAAKVVSNTALRWVGPFLPTLERAFSTTTGTLTGIMGAEDLPPFAPLRNAAVKRSQAIIDDMHLVDFKVRITQGGTEAVTRVIIDSEDRKGRRWSTVGVSANIVDASFQALLDAIRWKLVRDTE